MNASIVFTAVITILQVCNGANILAFFPVGGSSHFLIPDTLLKLLAARGHNVTVISSYAQKKPVKNLHDIDISSVGGHSTNSLPFSIVSTVLQSTVKNFQFIANISRSYCDIAFSFPEVRSLLTSGLKFDLVITEVFGADCAVGFAWKFEAPLISILTSRRTPWALKRIGNPENPSYMPMLHMEYSPQMTFVQRIINTCWYLYYTVGYEYYHNSGYTNEISRRFFGDNVPSVNEIVYNTSLVFVNSHFSIDQPHPMVPNYIEIAGIHVKPARPLPADIQRFLDEAKYGVIYFTLGSLIRVSTMPNETIRAFRDAFAELPQRVLWKFELELEDSPPNVFTSEWFPQNDIFNHSNIRLFISHGGNSGCIEAAHYGIPMVGIPLFFDQYKNIRSFVDKGVAVQINAKELTKENILAAIRKVINDKSYAERMKKLSHIFKDRPMSAADSAVYWTEYVIRHKGAHHLKSVATNMPWYKYFLIDVILVCCVALISFLYVSNCLICFCVTRMIGIFTRNKLKTN